MVTIDAWIDAQQTAGTTLRITVEEGCAQTGIGKKGFGAATARFLHWPSAGTMLSAVSVAKGGGKSPAEA